MKKLIFTTMFAFFMGGCGTVQTYHRVSMMAKSTMAATSSSAFVPPTDPCNGIAQNEILWSSLAMGFGVGAGAGGLSTIPVTSETSRAVLSGISLLFGVGSAIATGMATGYSNEFKLDHCLGD